MLTIPRRLRAVRRGTRLMPQKPDLHDLVQQAGDEVRRTTGRTGRAPPRKLHTGWKALAAWSALIALIAFGEMHVRELEIIARGVMPERAATGVERELDRVLTQARDAIEAARGTDGTLPEALPHAALAAVVRYELSESAYLLSMSSSGVTVTLDGDGNRQVTRADR